MNAGMRTKVNQAVKQLEMWAAHRERWMRHAADYPGGKTIVGDSYHKKYLEAEEYLALAKKDLNDLLNQL